MFGKSTTESSTSNKAIMYYSIFVFCLQCFDSVGWTTFIESIPQNYMKFVSVYARNN